MANEYIRKQDAKGALQEKVFHNLTDEFYGAMQAIDELPPAADVVQVVRCKDCKHCVPDAVCGQIGRLWCKLKRLVKPDDFCSYGKRKEG